MTRRRQEQRFDIGAVQPATEPVVFTPAEWESMLHGTSSVALLTKVVQALLQRQRRA